MNEILRQALTILFARGFTRIAQFIAFLLLARFLTPAEFGWYGIITTAIVLASMLGSLGLRQSVAYQIGRKDMTVGEGTATVLAAWPVLALVSAGVVFWLYGRDVPGLSTLNVGAALVAGVGGSMLVMLLQGIYLGRGEVNAFSLTESMPRTLLTVFAGALAFLGMVTLSSALWAQVLSYVLVMPVALWLVMRGVNGLRPRPGRLPGMLGYGLAFAANLFLITLCSRLSMFVIEHFSGADGAGQFFAAVRVNEIFLEAATAFGLVLFSNSVREGENKAIPARNARIACWIFWSFSLVGLMTALLAPLLLRLLLGQGYESAGGALQVLAISLGPAAASKIIYPTLAGQGRPLFGTPAILLSLAVNLGLAWLLVPGMGLLGGAVALVVGHYLLYIGYAISCSRLFAIPFRDFFIPQRNDAKGLGRGLQKAVKRVLPRKAT
ncbi:MAG: hypothetical protein ABS75_04610 [Pelagibacterium sp. SCN 63-23]|nr:MAG: hypothetical protein ABS75_04610 [Pelagibacterium sp. SCN 63-23]